MDAVRTVPTDAPKRRRPEAEERIRELISRHKAERDTLTAQAEYMRRVAVMLIPFVPKPTVARVLKDAKGENWNAGPR